MNVSADLIQSYSALLTMACLPILIGSFLARHKPSHSETLSQKDVFMFPVIGSVVLFSLYLCFKFLPKEWLNYLLQIYFALLGIGAVFKVLNPLVSRIVPYSWTKKAKSEVQLPFSTITNYLFEIKTVQITLTRIISFVFAASVGLFYFQTKHWVANNIFGEAFSISSIELISLGSFTNGAILLIGLFFYDIFWVFGTEVMVTVAKSFDAPIKLIWPRAQGYSLLGLGDIVIPGIFVAQMLRFDDHLRRTNPSHGNIYFWTCFVSYILGLVATVAVLTIFQAGQPALLYLVPACLGSVTLLALVRGEIKELFAYSDAPDAPATEKTKRSD
uniref:Uncharacterized protein n=1 Tax=Percolomonas cosmopolitus TaxID=63605 RepID=A0A7S1KMI0_9EUKA